jgi:hypothetical protein
MSDTLAWRAASCALASLIAANVAACTTTTINPANVAKPAASYTTVVLGDITASDKVARSFTPVFRAGFLQELQHTQSFETVLDHPPETLPPGAIIVTGDIAEFDRGNKFARALIGFGAGRERIHGNFEIRDTQGSVLASFESGKAYSGGVGIGGAGFVGVDALMKQLGAETAKAVWRWSAGMEIDADAAPPDRQR